MSDGRLRGEWRSRHVVGLTVAAAALAGAFATAADADSLHTSIPLREVLARARSNPQVELMVRLQLKRENVRREDVICRATVLDRNWHRLSGTYLSPYDCVIGSSRLVLTSKPVYLDASGQRMRRSDPELRSRAVQVNEHFFRWRWQRA